MKCIAVTDIMGYPMEVKIMDITNYIWSEEDCCTIIHYTAEDGRPSFLPVFQRPSEISRLIENAKASH